MPPPYDEVERIIDNAWAISVGPCSCRRTRRIMGEGCGHLEEDMCMYINDNAKFFSKQGSHRLVSKEEAYEILQRAEDNGLVHEINEADGYDGPTAICNCCGCSCLRAAHRANYFNDPDMLRSNYVARVDKRQVRRLRPVRRELPDRRAQAGRRSSARNPRAPDDRARPSTMPWTEKHFNVDYRTNRTQVVDTGTAPCKIECPAHIPVQGYIKLASQGKLPRGSGAHQEGEPVPGGLRPHLQPQAARTPAPAASIDEPIAIDDIKKFIADKELERRAPASSRRCSTRPASPSRTRSPSSAAALRGLSCAYYLAVKGYPVTVFEKDDRARRYAHAAASRRFRLEKRRRGG